MQGVVLHVAEVGPQLGRDGPLAAEHLGQHVAGRRQQAGHPQQLLAQPEQVGRRALVALEDRLLDALDPLAHPVLHHEVAVDQALEQRVGQARHAVRVAALVLLPAPARLLAADRSTAAGRRWMVTR